MSRPKSETDSEPGPRIDIAKSLDRDARARTEVMRRHNLPFFLRPILLHGHPLTMHQGGSLTVVMEPVQFTLRMAGQWWEPCTRRDEWQAAPGATATIPPCMAHYTNAKTKNCPEHALRACTDAVASQLGLPFGPVLLPPQDSA